MPRRRRQGWERFYLTEPDYEREVYQVPDNIRQRMLEQLGVLYGRQTAKSVYVEVERLMRAHHARKPREMIEFETTLDPAERFNEEDVILITYGDLVLREGESPLDTMVYFCEAYLRRAINTIHILPFFPYSSDRGFSVMDFEQVNPKLGTWDDIDNLKEDFRLMFDGVFNHVSAKSRWFAEFRDANPDFEDFFIVFSTRNAISADHLQIITRPRRNPILSEFTTMEGRRWVWTTFSPDQVDLNYRNPRVLVKMLQILMYYVWRGADIIRLDAVTYLWAELGTECVHLRQTHAIIKLYRAVLEAVAPSAALITETNVPHALNLAYFGDGTDEAHMVYNFALPPLVLHSFQTQNAATLTKWAANLEPVSDTATYLNFLDSHDGVGLTPAQGILTPDEVEMLALRVLEHGGFVSYKDNGDGTSSPYEANITWYSAINRFDADETADFQIRRFLASRSIPLVLMGVPAVYLHGLLGSKNDRDAVVHEAQNRSINRMVIDADSLEVALNDPASTTRKISLALTRMILKRTQHKAFHPNGPQKVLSLDDGLFAVLRSAPDGSQHVLCLTNVTPLRIDVAVSPRHTGLHVDEYYDILGKQTHETREGVLAVTILPYDVLWLRTPARGTQ
ncbi:MAG: sugar phosphorylase [Desulfatibacillaceae bacterium]